MTALLSSDTNSPRRGANSLPVSAFFVDSLALAKRQLLHTLRTPQTAIAAVTSPILFLVLFRYVFGGAIPIPNMGYVDYVVPAMLVQNIVFGGFQSATGLSQDAADGIVDRFRSLPSPRSALLAGRSIADTLTQFVAHALVIVTGVVIGFRFHTSALNLVLFVVLLLAIGVGMFSVFAAMGLSTRNAETVNALTLPGFLLLFVSSAFIPVATLPGWLQGFAKYQPVTVFTDTLRYLMESSISTPVLEHSRSWYLLGTLGWCVALTVIGGTVALNAYRRL